MTPEAMTPNTMTPTPTPTPTLPVTRATGLYRAETGHYELQLTFDGPTGHLAVTLLAPRFEAFGHIRAEPIGDPSSATLVANDIPLHGYDDIGDRFRRFEVSIGATWTRNPRDGGLELVGTALVTDLESGVVDCLPAVRQHPFNRLDRVEVGLDPSSGGLDLLVAA